MLHPVGDLPAAVYWRRRLMVLTLLISVLGGGGWLAVAAATGESGSPQSAASSTEAEEPARPPALERVVPSLASVQTPTPAPTTTVPPQPQPQPPAPPAPAPGGPCADDMIGLAVRAPAVAPPGSKPTFDLVVTNVSPVPCVRALDKGLQEIVLLDPAGNRLWGSNDCFPEAGTDTRMLAPGEAVAFPLVWGGRTSAPGCTAARTPLPPGQYLLRGRLDTATSADAPFAIG